MNLRPDRLPQRVRFAAYSTAVLVLLYLTLAPQEALPPQENIWDKAEHAIAWGVLAAAGLLFWPERPGRVAAFALGLGAVVEVLQAGLPFGRHGDVRDLFGDGVGVLVAMAFWALVRWAGGRSRLASS